MPDSPRHWTPVTSGPKAAFTVVILVLASPWLADTPSASARGFRAHMQTAFFTMLDPPLTDDSVILASAVATGPTIQPLDEGRRGGAESVNGSTVAALDDGALFIDSDSGYLVYLDGRNRVRARAAVGHGAAQLVFDPTSRIALVSDRHRDRIAAFEVADELTHVRDIPTRTEPYGLALTPDRSTLLVTTIADRQLTAYQLATGHERWSLPLAPEPRAVALAPDGARAVVTFAAQSTLARVRIADDSASPEPDDKTGNGRGSLSYASLVRYEPERSPLANVVLYEPHPGSGPPGPQAGRKHARAVYSAVYLDARVVAVPYQESTPAQRLQRVDVGTYGGSRLHLPIKHMLAFVADRNSGRARAGQVAHAELGVGHIRTMVYDRRADRLFLASYGGDRLVAFDNASRPSIELAWQVQLDAPKGACGPAGLALRPDGSLLIHCHLARSVATLDATRMNARLNSARATIIAGEPVTRSRLSASAQRGRLLFTQANNPSISDGGAMACIDCHPEGRTDGLSWAIDGGRLQTPVLAGRLVDTAPYKWNGHDLTLGISINNTIQRLGGLGLSDRQNDDLVAFLESLPAPRRPAPSDPNAVARGRVAFTEAGCGDCHKGPKLADRHLHELTTNLPYVNTPSLVGLSISAPYLHDGSAASLRAVLLGNGTVHDMADVSDLEPGQLDDLISYLSGL